MYAIQNLRNGSFFQNFNKKYDYIEWSFIESDAKLYRTKQSAVNALKKVNKYRFVSEIVKI